MMTPLPEENPLLTVIIGVITPFLIAGGIVDAALARTAALQAIDACRSDTRGSLIGIGQVVGFALASLDSLRLSAAPELSLAMTLKLRANATAMHRATQTGAVRVETPLQVENTAAEDEALAAAEAEANTALQQARTMPHPSETPAAASDDERKRLWADAMTDVAAECARDLHRLPPAKRRSEIIRIGALSATARALKQQIPLREQAPQQPVAQDELMIQRPKDVQPDDPQQNERDNLMHATHLPSPG